MHKLSTSQWIAAGICALVIPATILTMSYRERPVTSAPVVMEGLSESLTVQHWVFPEEGPKVYAVERHSRPIVDIRLVFDAGSARDQVPGEAYLLSQLLTKGTKKYSADQIAEKMESVGARLSVGVDRDKLTISCRSLSDDSALDVILPVLKEILSTPQIPEEAFVLAKNQLDVQLTRRADEPKPQVEEAFMATIYGDHPYGHSVLGTKKSIASITTADLKQFHNKYFTPENMTVVVVGDATSGAVDRWIQGFIQGMPKGSKPAPLPKLKQQSKDMKKHVALESSQTHIRFGLPVEFANDTDHYKLKVAEQVLGGGFNSRLFNSVRRDGGLAYHVSANSDGWLAPGPFTIKLETRAEKADEAVKKVKKVLAELMEKGPTDEELSLAKQSVKGQLTLMFSSNAWIASHLESMAFYDKPLDFFESYGEHLDTVTAEDVMSVLKQRAPLEKWHLVTAGPV